MRIDVAVGVGTGPTKLAAFDSALLKAGVANFNLITLSSVIPAASEVVSVEGPASPIGEWGDRLYVVMAQERIDTRNAEAWAAIGWVQDTTTGRGLFVEHEGASEAEVRRDVEDSLQALVRGRGMSLGTISMCVAGTSCSDEAVCALVVAIYRAEGWA